MLNIDYLNLKGLKKNFLLHLKECEFRYNNGNNSEILYQKLLKLIRKNPLKLNWAKIDITMQITS